MKWPIIMAQDGEIATTIQKQSEEDSPLIKKQILKIDLNN